MTEMIKSTTCPMDCPDTCNLEVTVTDGRIKKITGGHDHPNTNGFICTKVSRFARRVYSSERLRTPLRNTGSKESPSFDPISWSEAINEIVTKYKQIQEKWGGEAILPYNYGGSNGFLCDEYVDALFFSKLGASRLKKTLCAVPTTEVATGMYGRMPGVAYEDFIHAKMIIIWGANPGRSHIHLVPYLKEARKNGAFIAAIDPVNNFSSDMIDLHIPVKPGTDLPLALSMINYWKQNDLLQKEFINDCAINTEILLEKANDWSIDTAAQICGVSEDAIMKLADLYAEKSPALIRCGWGLERNRNGGQAVAAILAIPALLEKFGETGGGYTLSNSGFLKFKPDFHQQEDNISSRTLEMTKLGEILNNPDLNPPVKSLFIYNSNPVATVPDQNAIIKGLNRDDLFTIVFDQVMTDSARFADIILPATTFLEHHDIRRSYGTYHFGHIKPTINPIGESKPNHQVFSMLGQAMGWNDQIFNQTDTDIVEKIESQFSFYQNDNSFKSKAARPIQFKTVFPATKDEKINFAPDQLGPNPYEFIKMKDTKYPFAMISPATDKTINSSMGEYNLPEQFAQINPDDAMNNGMISGDIIRIYNQQGEIECKVKVDKNVRPGVVVLPKGVWRKSSINGSTATALCPTHVNVVGGGACYNDARVQISKLT